MAGFDLTSDVLVAAVRRAGFLPDVSDQSDEDILAFADEVVGTLLSATIRKDREGRRLAYADTTIVPGTTSYALPPRAMAQTVRGVMVLRPDGTSYPLTEADPLALRQRFAGNTNPVDPWWYAFDGDTTIDLGSVSTQSGWTLRVYYLRALPKLVLTSNAAPIAGVASSTEIELTGTPPTIVTTADAVLDIVSGVEPFGQRGEPVTVVSWSSPDLTVLEDVSGYGIATASPTSSPDYLCQAGSTVYPPIPKAMTPALIRLTLAKALRAIGDPRAAEAEDEGQRELTAAVRVLAPRDDRRSRATVGDSPLRAVRGGGWRWPR